MNFATFLNSRYSTQIFVALLVFLSLAVLAFLVPASHQTFAWLDPIVGVATLVFAVFLWLNGLRREWRDSLPKRLTVYFRYKGGDALVFRNILLFNESDARAWSQQIARQKAGGDIEFEPFFRFTDKGVSTTKDRTSTYKNYEMIYFLSNIPPQLKTELGYDDATKAIKWCKEWVQIENADGTISMDELPILSNTKM
jgi:hypothetical protein